MTLLSIPLNILKLIWVFQHKLKIIIFRLKMIILKDIWIHIDLLFILYDSGMLDIHFITNLMVKNIFKFSTLLLLKCSIDFLFLLLRLLNIFLTNRLLTIFYLSIFLLQNFLDQRLLAFIMTIFSFCCLYYGVITIFYAILCSSVI